MFNLFKKKEPYVPTGRIGYMEFEYDTNGFESGVMRVRVEETATEGKYSHLKLLSVTGASDRVVRHTWNRIDRFVPTKDVDWVTSD